MDANQKPSSFQGGYRSKSGTLEQVFCLWTLIQSKLRQPSGKVFVAYIDASSAFDSCLHPTLLNTLHQIGISTKFINIIKSIYQKAKAQVKTPQGLTKQFPIQKGVLQGDPISGYLFNLYLDDIVHPRIFPPSRIGTEHAPTSPRQKYSGLHQKNMGQGQ
jgi:hypothetical protein